MIFNCPKLTYLDSRPIQPRDRAVISAWKEVKSTKYSAEGKFVRMQGGIEAERRERERLIQQEQKDMQDSILALIRNRWKCHLSILFKAHFKGPEAGREGYQQHGGAHS